MVTHVRQPEPYGCAVACCAMVRAVSYEETAEVFGPPGRGFTHMVWQDYLARYGFATQILYQFDQLSRRKRDPWPLNPWADLHLCSVDAGHGIGSHLVLLLRNGTVLDPATDAPRSLSDYASVAYMAGVFRVGALPFAPVNKDKTNAECALVS